MKLYQIADLERLTGIKAHTIRIWEKRYNLIQPERTSTNIRRYTDAQVKKLLNVSTLLSKGYKISKIAALKEKQIFQVIKDIQENGNDDVICTSFINNLASAMLTFNEQAFEKTYAAIINRFGVFNSMLKVIYPLLHKIGLMWVVNDVTPVQEHFASCIIKRKLMAAIDGLSIPKNKKKKFLLLMPPGEWHEISLLFANYMIKSKGFETIYLGQNVPYENIAPILKATKPNFILIFFITTQNSTDVYFQLKENLRLPKGVTLLISGNPTITSYLKTKQSATILQSPHNLLSYLQ